MTRITKPVRAALRALPLDVTYQVDHWRRVGRHRGLHDRREAEALARYDALGCVFVHVPKTGGNSVASALFGTDTFGHKSVPSFKRILGPVEYYRRFSFAFVRNPYSRLVSAYTFLKKGGKNDKDQAFSEGHLASLGSFEEFVLEWLNPDTMRLTPHLRPQTTTVCDRFVRGGRLRVGVDFLGRYERLDHDFSLVAARLGVSGPSGEPVALPHMNPTGRQRDPEEFYTSGVRARVASLYRSDFETLGYTV